MRLLSVVMGVPLALSLAACKHSPEARIERATNEARAETKEAIEKTNDAIAVTKEAKEEYLGGLQAELGRHDQRIGELQAERQRLDEQIATMQQNRNIVVQEMSNFRTLTGEQLVNARANLEQAMHRLRSAGQVAGREVNRQ